MKKEYFEAETDIVKLDDTVRDPMIFTSGPTPTPRPTQINDEEDWVD